MRKYDKSSTTGRLARSSGPLTAECVEFEVKRALEWLQEKERFVRPYFYEHFEMIIQSSLWLIFIKHIGMSQEDMQQLWF
jgi:hypothetical protein